MAVVLSLMPSDAIYHDLMCLVTHDTPPHEVMEVHAHPMQHVARPACEVVEIRGSIMSSWHVEEMFIGQDELN